MFPYQYISHLGDQLFPYFCAILFSLNSIDLFAEFVCFTSSTASDIMSL